MPHDDDDRAAWRAALPARADAFVGRSDELARIAQEFARGERLVTITGAPGIGKTRLALEYAARLDAGPVVFCDLTDATDAAEVVSALGHAIGRPGTPEAKLGAALAARGPLCLVVDNAELVAQHVAARIERLRADGPEARWLVTSRLRLRSRGEVCVQLGALGVGRPGDAAGSDAATLFVDRVRRVDAAWGPDADPATFQALLALLEGVPLAIELAAGRAGVLPPSTLLARLRADQFAVLRSARDAGAAARPVRHATLRAGLDASWALLEPWERDAAAQCAVFRGGFALAAAEAVVDLGAHADAPAVLDAAELLRDHSVLRSHEGRLRMYASLREHAWSMLAPRDAAAASERHARYYAALVTATAHDVRREHGRLMLERENVLAAVEWLLGPGRAPSLAARTLDAYSDVIRVDGPFARTCALCEATRAALATAPEDTADLAQDRARMVSLHGGLLLQLGRVDEAVEALEQASALAETLGDDRTAGRALRGLASAMYRRGDLAGAARQLERALEPLTGSERAVMLRNLATIARERGDLAGSRRYAEQALTTARSASDAYIEAEALAELAIASIELDQLDAADAYVARAIEAFRALGSLRGEAYAGISLAAIAQLRGEHAAAIAAYARAASLAVAADERRLEAFARGYGGVCKLERGDAMDAHVEITAARALFESVGDDRYAALMQGYYALVLIALGQQAEAREAVARATASLRTGDIYADVMVLVRAVGAAQGRAQGQGDRAALDAAVAAGRAVTTGGLDVRVLRRLLERALNGPVHASTPGALRVEREGRFAVLPDATRVDVGMRRVLRRLLVVLAEQRLAAPGAPLDNDALCRAVWPGERILPDAARNRLHVALTALRGCGLRTLIARVEGGYLLDPAVPLAWLEPAEPGPR